MAPETRSQDARRIDDSLEAVNQRIDGIEVKLQARSDDLAQLKAMMKEITTQQIVIKQTLQSLSGETSPSQNTRSLQHPATAIDALCCRFGGQKDPLEELKEHKQEGNLSLQHPATAIDALCCRFGGQKNPLEELKEHKQARLQNNTLTHRKINPHYLSVGVATESYITTFALSYEGKFGEIYWASANERWEHTKQYSGDDCDIYGTCGPFGFCNTQSLLICRCLAKVAKTHFEVLWKKKKKSYHGQKQLGRRQKSLAGGSLTSP